jgi:hypothetical protein
MDPDPDPDPQHAYFINVGSRNIADLGAAKLWVRLSYGCGVAQIFVSRGLLYGRPGGGGWVRFPSRHYL